MYNEFFQGTYGPGVGLTDESECTQCDGGHYCDSPGMSSVGPECYEGYYCREGVNTPAPSDNNTGDGSKQTFATLWNQIRQSFLRKSGFKTIIFLSFIFSR